MARKPRSRRAKARAQGGLLRLALIAAAVVALAAAGLLAWTQITAQDMPRSAPALAKSAPRHFPKGPVLDRSAPACSNAQACLAIIDKASLGARDWNAAIAQMPPKSTADAGVLACAKASRDTIPTLCALGDQLTPSTSISHLQILARIAEADQPAPSASGASAPQSPAANDVTAGGGSASGASVSEDTTGEASPAPSWLKTNAAPIATVLSVLALALAALTALIWWRSARITDMPGPDHGRILGGQPPIPSSQEPEAMTGAYPSYQRDSSRSDRNAAIDALETRLAALDQKLAGVERQATLREEALAQRLAKVEQDAKQREGAYREALEAAVRELKALIDKTDHRVDILQKYRGEAAPEPRTARDHPPTDGYEPMAQRLQQAGLRIAPQAFAERARALEAEFSQHVKLGAQPLAVRRALSVAHATAEALPGGLTAQHQAPLDALFGELAGPGYELIWPAINSTILDGEHIAVRREGEIGNQVAAVIAPGLRKVGPGDQVVLLLAQVAVH
jgi:hypothetical protein